MLRDNSLPIKGIEAIEKAFNSSSSAQSQLTWEPAYADLSKSGDLGYTYGFYKYEATVQDSTIIQEGAYVTIWKKNDSGEWKWVLDSGTEGLGK